MRSKLITGIVAVTLSFNFLTHASASKGGVEQTNNKFVVGFTYSDDGIPTLCNGALVAPDVIATARHCVVNRQGVYGTDYVFSAPGAKLDAPIDGNKVPTGVRKVIVPKQSPIEGLDLRLDIAFIVTNKAFATGMPIKFASAQQAASLNEISEIAGYGYGAVFETGALYASLPRKFHLSWVGSSLVENSNSYYELIHENNVACSGDSGGPVTFRDSDGKEFLLGVVSGAGEVADGCGTKSADNFYHLRITLFHPYLSQMPKIKKITCLKGSKKKVVSAAYPKCPTGYKIKK